MHQKIGEKYPIEYKISVGYFCEHFNVTKLYCRLFGGSSIKRQQL